MSAVCKQHNDCFKCETMQVTYLLFHSPYACDSTSVYIIGVNMALYGTKERVSIQLLIWTEYKPEFVHISEKISNKN